MGTHIDYEYAVNLEVHPKNEINIDITVASPCGMIDADAFPSTLVHFEMYEDQDRMHSFLTRRRARQANSRTSLKKSSLEELTVSTIPLKYIIFRT